MEDEFCFLAGLSGHKFEVNNRPLFHVKRNQCF